MQQIYVQYDMKQTPQFQVIRHTETEDWIIDEREDVQNAHKQYAHLKTFKCTTKNHSTIKKL